MLGDRTWETDGFADLVASGWAVASIDYRLSDEARFPAAVQDCKAAVRWLRARADQFGYDPDRLVAWGRSAGGHLAAMLGVTGDRITRFDDPALADVAVSSAVQAVVDFYGPTDFLLMDSQFADFTSAACLDRAQVHDTPDSPESLYLGAPIQTVPDLAAESNPVAQAASATVLPPFFLAAGIDDHLVPHQQTLILGDALKRAGAEVDLHLLGGVGHGGVEFERRMFGPAMTWLERHLR
jgi:acetyl esterase/lipase